MGDKEMALATSLDRADSMADGTRMRTLGTVRLHHHETKEIILIPTPSNDPNDPLNW
jgi:hypothetical protein